MGENQSIIRLAENVLSKREKRLSTTREELKPPAVRLRPPLDVAVQRRDVVSDFRSGMKVDGRLGEDQNAAKLSSQQGDNLAKISRSTGLKESL